MALGCRLQVGRGGGVGLEGAGEPMLGAGAGVDQVVDGLGDQGGVEVARGRINVDENRDGALGEAAVDKRLEGEGNCAAEGRTLACGRTKPTMVRSPCLPRERCRRGPAARRPRGSLASGCRLARWCPAAAGPGRALPRRWWRAANPTLARRRAPTGVTASEPTEGPSSSPRSQGTPNWWVRAWCTQRPMLSTGVARTWLTAAEAAALRGMDLQSYPAGGLITQ